MDPGVKLGLLSAVALYAVSFALPACEVMGGWVFGYAAFVFYLTESFFNPLALIAWAPNPLFWVGLFFATRGRWAGAVVASCLALVVGLLLCYDPDGGRFRLADYRVGYFCWLASMLALAGVASWRVVNPPGRSITGT